MSNDDLINELRRKAQALDEQNNSPGSFKPTCAQDDMKAAFAQSFKNPSNGYVVKNTLPPP